MLIRAAGTWGGWCTLVYGAVTQSPCCRVFLVCGNTLQLVITMAAMRWEPSFHAHILLQEIIHSYTKEMLCKECFFIRPVTALLHTVVVRCSELGPKTHFLKPKVDFWWVHRDLHPKIDQKTNFHHSWSIFKIWVTIDRAAPANRWPTGGHL